MVGDWLNRWFGRTTTEDLVPFFDIESSAVVQIPRRELGAGAIEVQIQGIEGLVWVIPEQLQQGPLRHPPFDEEIRDYLRQIQEAFAEHRDLTLEEWEEGFRRDANAEREIAIWSYAADVYRQFADNEPSKDRRADVYTCIVACMISSPDTVWKGLKPEVLTDTEAKEIVNCYYRIE